MGKNCLTPPSLCNLCALVFYNNGWGDRNTDARVKTADGPSTSDKNLNFGPLTLEFCGLVCAGWATRWALSRISSIKPIFYSVNSNSGRLIIRFQAS